MALLEEVGLLVDGDAREDQRVEAVDVEQVRVGWEPYALVAEVRYVFILSSLSYSFEL